VSEPPWDDAATARLRHMYLSGIGTYSSRAKLLGRSRCAVAGKIDRMRARWDREAERGAPDLGLPPLPRPRPSAYALAAFDPVIARVCGRAGA
jgi:hypothetical protein